MQNKKLSKRADWTDELMRKLPQDETLRTKYEFDQKTGTPEAIKESVQKSENETEALRKKEELWEAALSKKKKQCMYSYIHKDSWPAELPIEAFPTHRPICFRCYKDTLKDVINF